MQLTEPNWYHSVYYTNQKLSVVKCNYSTIEREALGMIYNINKFWHYLLGRNFTSHVDYAAVLYLVSKESLMGKLARSMLLLQELEFDIQHRPGTQHTIANYLSRIKKKTKALTTKPLPAESTSREGPHFL